MAKGGSSAKKGSSGSKAGKGGKQGATNGRANDDEGSDSDEADADVANSAKDGDDSIPSGTAKSASSAFDVSKLRQRTGGRGSKSGTSSGPASGKVAPAPSAAEEAGKKKGKAMRKWDGQTESKMKDFSKPLEEGATERGVVDMSKAEKSLMDVDEDEDEAEDEDMVDEDEEEEEAATGAKGARMNGSASKASGGWLSSIFQRCVAALLAHLCPFAVGNALPDSLRKSCPFMLLRALAPGDQ